MTGPLRLPAAEDQTIPGPANADHLGLHKSRFKRPTSSYRDPCVDFVWTWAAKRTPTTIGEADP